MPARSTAQVYRGRRPGADGVTGVRHAVHRALIATFIDPSASGPSARKRVLAAPLLQSEFGIPILIAHLVIFWYSQDSNVTPPVALAAFAGAAIANGDPMRTGFRAWKFAKGLYLIPLFMVYNPEIIVGGDPWYVAWTVLTAMVALFAFAAALEGYMFTHMYWFNRIIVAVGLVMIFYPDFRLELGGFAIMMVALAIKWAKRGREARMVGASA